LGSRSETRFRSGQSGLGFTVIALLSLGCGGDGEEVDPCSGDEQAEMETVPDADLIATIQYDELVEMSDEGNEDKSTILSGDFVDLSNYETVTDVTSFGEDCVGMLGRPGSTGEAVPLTVDTFVISSPIIGEETVEVDEHGTYFTGFSGDFFSDEGGETITVTVSSSGESGTFPPFSDALTAPPALENATAAVTQNGTLKVEWQEGESTYVEIVLRSTDVTDETMVNRVRCFYLADDGCFVVPYSAVEWLTSNGVNKVKVRMERHTLKISKPADNAIAEIDAMRSIEFNINI
jgi:hypothetical protein